MNTQQADAIFNRIRTLAERSSKHRALNNGFYDLWMAKRLPVEAVEIVARNFFARVSRTPDRIALAFLGMTDPAARAMTVRNLSDEMGDGDSLRIHSVLLRTFLEELLSRLRSMPVFLDEIDAPLLPSTLQLISEGEKLFGNANPHVATGALLAQEWHAYPQLVFLYEGVRNYRDDFDSLQQFHEACEYFYLHLGATEKEHRVDALSTAVQSCSCAEDVEAIEEGFHAYLDMLAANWEELESAVQDVSA